MPMCGMASDEVVLPRPGIQGDDEPGIRLAVGHCSVDAAGTKQLPGTERENRLAVCGRNDFAID
jgi:hypothetical protein